MKNNKGIRVASLFMAMLIVSMFSVAPAIACVPGGSCGEEVGDENIISGDPVELEGSEKDELLIKALDDKAIIDLKEELNNDGFTQKDVATYSLEIIAEDGSVIDAKIATFTYESTSGDVDELTYVYNEETGESFTARGLYGCPECLALIVLGGFGCTAFCVTAGALTMGVACIGCLAAAATVSLCPCYTCGCSMGLDTGCEMADKYGC